MNSEQLFHKPALNRNSIHEVRYTEAQARQQPCAIGIPEQPVAQGDPFAPRPLRSIAMDEFGKIELELMVVSRRVGTLHFAKLALKARVHQRSRLAWRYSRDISVVFLVEEREQIRKDV